MNSLLGSGAGTEQLAARVCKQPPSLKTVLLVEDNTALALRLGEMYELKEGYQVLVASNLVTALQFLRSCKPDLMLLDERLLMRNGIDFGARLSLMKDLQDIPLLLFGADFR
jgi:DNA-binding response OmpR family regulator